MRRLLVLAAVLSLALMAALPAAASQSYPVVIDIDTTFDPDANVIPSRFVATGPAVEAGLICPEGWASNVAEKVTPTQVKPTGIKANFLSYKLFDCDDESGAFTLKGHFFMQMIWQPDGAPIATNGGPWMVFDGTEAYARLRGTGDCPSEFVWILDPPGFYTHDHFTGQVHVD